MEADEGGGRQPKPYFAKRRPTWEPAKLPDGLEVDDTSCLEGQTRQNCPKWWEAWYPASAFGSCSTPKWGVPPRVSAARSGRSRHLYCYDCLVPFTQVGARAVLGSLATGASFWRHTPERPCARG